MIAHLLLYYIKKTYSFLRYTPKILCNFIFLLPAQNENFSIVRVRVLSESANRRFTSTDFDTDLQPFKHEKSPMESDFFGQISFLSPQYVYVRQNLVFRAIFESVSNEKVTNDFSISVSFALF